MKNRIITMSIVTILLGVYNMGYAQKNAVFIVKKENISNQKTLTNYEENKKTALAVSQAILEARWADLDNLLDDDFIYTGEGTNDMTYTKDEYIGFMQDMRGALSNFEMILTHVVVDGNLVSARFISNVVNTGKFMGAPANEKNLSINGTFTREVRDGKVMNEWQTTDLLGTMKQIGGGSLFFYSIFATGKNYKMEKSKRKPNDFLNINGNVKNFDLLSVKEKTKYLKKYLKEFNKKQK